MNYRLLSKVLGYLLLLLGGAMLLCLGYAFWVGEHRSRPEAIQSLGLSIAVTLLTGLVMVFLGRRSGREVLRKEAIAIVGLGWILCGVFGALPYAFGTPRLGLVAAFFESVSGFTTTGASVIVNVDHFPRSILLWRALSQWLGGVGILVLFVALLSYLGAGSKALFRHESSAKSGEGIQARIRDVALRLWQIYAGLTAACCLGLMALGMSFFDAICHTFAAVSTGGFSTRNESIAAYHSVGIELWLVLFMVLGGANFLLYAWLLRHRWDRWAKDEETKAYLALIILSSFVIALDLTLLEHHHSFGLALRESLFQVVSIMTTTGFASADFDRWPHFSRLMLIFLMGVGGCAGSTAGGIKVSRWLLFFKTVRLEIINAFRPNQVIALQLNGNLVDASLRTQTVFFVALAGVTVALGTGLVSLLEPALNIETSLSAVMATLFNIGPGLGVVGPTQNYFHFAPVTLVLLSLLMVLGRLEFFALLVLFIPSLWRKY